MAKFTAVVKEVSFIQVEVEADTQEEAEELIDLGEFDIVASHGDTVETEFIKFLDE